MKERLSVNRLREEMKRLRSSLFGIKWGQRRRALKPAHLLIKEFLPSLRAFKKGANFTLES